MYDEDRESQDKRMAEYMAALKAEHERPEGQTWQQIASEPEDPVSFSDRVSLPKPSLLVGCIRQQSELEAENGRLRAAIEAMVQAAYDTSYQTLVHRILDIGREALNK